MATQIGDLQEHKISFARHTQNTQLAAKDNVFQTIENGPRMYGIVRTGRNRKVSTNVSPEKVKP